MCKLNKLWLLALIFSINSFAQKKEPWIAKPISEWPQIALINEVQYKNGDSYIDPSFSYAGTGFLINIGTDTLAATAKHILWVARNKKINAVAINDDINEWIMSAKDEPGKAAIINKLINEDTTEVLEGAASSILERDAIFFTVKTISPAIFPLKPRFSPLGQGEKVFIISNAYADSGQTVREGRVLKTLGYDILIGYESADNLNGASGSPIIDSNGHLIGSFSSLATHGDKKAIVAISTEYLQQVLKGNIINLPKKDYGEIILKTALSQGATKAIEHYRALTKEPQNFYLYNLRSANRNGLREASEKLIEMGRIKDAVALLRLNLEIQPDYYHNYNILARAYLLVGKTKKAIRLFKKSVKKYMGSDNEAFTELEKLGVTFC
ncbi:MAG TPA: trypsin-like peptidase domain-containing protein [Flavobacterium sp.]|nr:trypsin-like peptidase domain-containing protein [Flavobacterium sp.]